MLTVLEALLEPIPDSLREMAGPEPTIAELDQLQAASDDSWRLLMSVLPDEEREAAITSTDTSNEFRERGAFVLSKFFEQRGIDFNCPHVQSMHSPFPVLFVPRFKALGCRKCVGHFILEMLDDESMESLTFVECDFCQKETDPEEGGEIISVMGPVTIVGHYCESCLAGWRQLLAVS